MQLTILSNLSKGFCQSITHCDVKKNMDRKEMAIGHDPCNQHARRLLLMVLRRGHLMGQCRFVICLDLDYFSRVSVVSMCQRHTHQSV